MSDEQNERGTEKPRSWVEEIEIASDKLVEKVKEWAADASVRRVRVKTPDGDVALDIPLTVGGIVGGVVVLAAPVLAALGAVAAFVAKLNVEIVRVEPEANEVPEARDVTPPEDAGV